MEKGIAATEEYILLGGVQEHCLDKQRVKEIIMSYDIHSFNDSQDLINTLFKELGIKP